MAVVVRANATYCVYLHLFHRYCGYFCRPRALWAIRLEPSNTHQQLAEPSVPVLRWFRFLPRCSRGQHFSKQSLCSQRSSRSFSCLHQHSPWAADMRTHCVGHGAMEDIGDGEWLLELHVCLQCVSGAYCCDFGVGLLVGARHEV